jgi:hypothetical protein
MFQFNYRLKVAERVKAKCERHPRYNPERDGRGGIKGGCSTCFSLFDLHQARLSLDAAHREFLRRASPGHGFVSPVLSRSHPNRMHHPCKIHPSESGAAFAALLLEKMQAIVSKRAPLISLS